MRLDIKIGERTNVWMVHFTHMRTNGPLSNYKTVATLHSGPCKRKPNGECDASTTKHIGTAFCSKLDHFVKFKGRKLAFTRSMEQLVKSNRNWSKEVRRQLWQAYLVKEGVLAPPDPTTPSTADPAPVPIPAPAKIEAVAPSLCAACAKAKDDLIHTSRSHSQYHPFVSREPEVCPLCFSNDRDKRRYVKDAEARPLNGIQKPLMKICRDVWHGTQLTA